MNKLKYKSFSGGSFGNKKIYYKYYSVPKSNVLYIFFHGAYGSGLESRYRYLAEEIVNNKLGNVVLYESSRDKNRFGMQISNFEEYKIGFKGKTFFDEVYDAELVLKRVTKVLNPHIKKIVFVGFSLGGTISSFLINAYRKYLTSVILFGSGVTTRGFDSPILSTYPSKMEILKNYDGYFANVVLVQGTADNVVPIEEARSVILSSSSYKRTLILLKDVDHRFMVRDGKLIEKELNKQIFSIISMNS